LPEDPVEREEELKKLDFVLGTSIAQRFSLLKPILTTLLLNFRAYGTGEVQYELVSKLLENGANQNAITGKLYKMPEKTEMIFYKGPVLQGLIFGDGQTIETIIAAERIGQPVPTFEKWPDLDIHVGIIRLLLQKKADPNQKSPGGITCAEGISNMWLWNNRPENQQGNRHVHQINQFCEQAMNILLSFGAHVTPLVLNNAQTLLGFGVKQLASQLYYNNQRLEILGKQSGTKRKYEEGGNAN
jgi:hypothetical protein